MAITQSIETVSAKLSSIAVTSGQVIYVRDTQELHFDSLNGTRVRIADVVWLDTDGDRAALVSPQEKLYYVRGTGALWAYDGAWVNLSAAAPRYVASITADAWTGTAAPYTYTITAATHGKGSNPVVQCTDSAGNVAWFGVRIAADGNIMLYTNEKTAAKITVL